MALFGLILTLKDFTAEGLGSSVIRFPRGEMEQRGSSQAGGVTSLLAASGGAARFIPRATAAPFMPAAFTSRPADAPAAAASALSAAAPPVATSIPAAFETPDPSSPRITVNLPPTSTALLPASDAPDASSDLRMVVLVGIPPGMSLYQISNSISSGLFGAVFSIAFGTDHGVRCVRIIFRDAMRVGTNLNATPGAAGYYAALTDALTQPFEERDLALWPFPQEATVEVRLQSHPETDMIKRMRASIGHDGSRIQAISRRLTLVGPRQLFNHFRERDFMKVALRSGAVKVKNIQRVCVYNSGNATIIFANVPTAVEALKCFDKYNETSDDILRPAVSFSKDPCEVIVGYSVDPTYGHIRGRRAR